MWKSVKTLVQRMHETALSTILQRIYIRYQSLHLSISTRLQRYVSLSWWMTWLLAAIRDKRVPRIATAAFPRTVPIPPFLLSCFYCASRVQRTIPSPTRFPIPVSLFWNQHVDSGVRVPFDFIIPFHNFLTPHHHLQLYVLLFDLPVYIPAPSSVCSHHP